MIGRMVIFVMSLALICNLGVLAQTPKAPTPAPPSAKPAEPVAAMQAAGFKMGFIDLERALLQVEEGKKEFGELEKFVRDKETDAKVKQEEVENMRKQMSAQDKNLKEEAKAQLQRNIDAKMTELERFTQDTQRDIDSRRGAAVNKIGSKMQPIINSLAKDQGYAAVFVYAPNSPLYAYIDLEKYDVTNAVIERYNRSSPVAAGAPGDSSPAKTVKK
ncbi:MAG: OmpH family outer membrane protein [Acidobacteria bacterium]|nr:OmpH family outer membrane protein [Acidobacteriota bacterium]MBI3656409.1 OmpH family outer membrane protein [Acidobacteriota bacterium]